MPKRTGAAASLGLPRSTVADYLRRFHRSGLPWPLPADVDEAVLEARLFPAGPAAHAARPLPDWATVHAEHKRPGVTRQLLWLEYKAAHPDGYQYTQFCAHYARWLATLDPVHVMATDTRHPPRATQPCYTAFLATETASKASSLFGLRSSCPVTPRAAYIALPRGGRGSRRSYA